MRDRHDIDKAGIQIPIRDLNNLLSCLMTYVIVSSFIRRKTKLWKPGYIMIFNTFIMMNPVEIFLYEWGSWGLLLRFHNALISDISLFLWCGEAFLIPDLLNQIEQLFFLLIQGETKLFSKGSFSMLSDSLLFCNSFLNIIISRFINVYVWGRNF